MSIAFSRRIFFRGAALLLAGGALAACAPTPRGYEGQRRPLPIPPLMEGELIDGRLTFRLDAGAVNARILPDVDTPAWGFNGAHLGPTLRARRGDQVSMDVHNGLDEMTTIHWHGMKLPAKMDGGPHQPIEPGQTWTPQWTVDQPAATLWYHPHPHGLTGLHAYRGLAGLFYLEDEISEGLEVPADYGVDDIPVILMDHNFHEDGTLDEIEDPDLGLKGEVPTVNGITNAAFQATTRRVRLRILDASTMRFFHLRFSDGRPFQVLASDAGLLDQLKQVAGVYLSPGERVEILVDLEPGEEVMLETVEFPDNLGVPEDEFALDFGLGDQFELLHLTGPEDSAPAVAALPGVLGQTSSLDLAGAPEREFRLNTFEINDETMDMTRVDLTLDHDGPEVWTVINENSDWIHNFHIHNASFHVLEVRGTEAAIFTSGPKDTVALPPRATVRLAVTFGSFPDPEWAYMYHCHMLFHEDQGMMGQFVMVEPGGEADLGEIYGHLAH
ncbi:multicopper oxidase family protein [Corynebacterium sp. A21]|uniref:multicopper oxidase family protein n=1 Tax=Corynebacterium sp. A21 TaxID=3457318 RepID=UPI003FD4FA9F